MNASVDQLFAAMQTAVEANPGLKSKFNACVEFKLKDSDRSVTLNICKAPKNKPDLVVTASLDTLQKIFAKKMTPQQAFMKGVLKIKGNMGLAMKLTLVVNAARKQLKKQQAKL